MKIFLPG